MNTWQRFTHHPRVIRLLNWEYWPSWAVYTPMYLYWGLLALRNRSLFFFNASNPGIEYGGLIMESKMKIAASVPETWHPKTILVQPGFDESNLRQRLTEEGFEFPLIAKPDIGGKGRGVKKIDDYPELVRYLRHFPMDMLVQQWVPFPHEVGIFYVRMPGEARGRITGIVGKHFLQVRGDGRSSIEQLLLRQKRAILQLPSLRQALGDSLQEILPDGEERVLVPYGNHARGSLFLDYTHWKDETLEQRIDEICRAIPGFYFGRLDIRYSSLEKLKQGQEFSIIELNGAGSEPTHMYDPRHSIWFAWREIIRHWNLLSRISRINHQQHGVPYLSFAEGRALFRSNEEYDSLLASCIETQLSKEPV